MVFRVMNSLHKVTWCQPNGGTRAWRWKAEESSAISLSHDCYQRYLSNHDFQEYR